MFSKLFVKISNDTYTPVLLSYVRFEKQSIRLYKTVTFHCNGSIDAPKSNKKNLLKADVSREILL